MRLRAKYLMAFALLSLTLTNCASSGQAPGKGSRIKLSDIPPDIRACLAKEVPAPLPGEMTRERASKLIFAFRKSDYAKSKCGKRLIAWYDAQAQAFRK
jgi:hypothetical protein